MTNTIHFEHVSKQYRLGLTRTSLPGVVSSWFTRISGQARRSISSQQKEFWALRDVSFELSQGQSLALVGANGAGKTTILKLLANITKPTIGQISTKGRLSALIELGAGFHPDLTGRENIYLNGTILGLSRSQVNQRFDEIVEFSELEQFIDTPVKRYSSGMAIRLGFAVASCIEPEILLVDEVLAVGDASFQQKCLQRIRALIESGTTIIFVSHNFYLVQAVCQTALYLEKGQVRKMGVTKDIIDIYERDLQEARALKLVGSNPSLAEIDATDVEITKIEICNPENSTPQEIKSDEPLQIQVNYNAYKQLGKVNLSVFIKRADGLTCCMMRTKLDNYEISIEPGQGTVTLLLEKPLLVTGSYYAEVWFLNDSDSFVISPRAGRSDWFSVKGRSFSYDNNNGIYEPAVQWRHFSGLN